MKPKVLQIAKYMYPFLGGTEQVTRDIANALNTLGIENRIICFNENSRDGDVLSRRHETVYDEVDGVAVIRCATTFKIGSQAISVSYRRELKTVMNDFKPDVIILHYPNPYVTHFLLKYKSRKFKLFVYWHLDITKQRFLRTFFKGQNRQLIERADKILGATPIHLKESAYSEYFGTKAYLLPYMINIGKLQISDRDRKFAEKIRDTYPNKVIGFFIGRHVPYKGLQYLLEASREVKSDNLQILIAGRGEETNKLMKYAEGDNKVRFLGVIDDAAKRAYLKACDIICFPSVTRSEAFGIALAEGMYFGKPAITFTIPGSGENYVNLNGVTGIECSCRDSRAYAEALDLLAQNKELRSAYGINAHKRIVDNFTEEQFVENIKQLIV